jgi:hypothetical protein
MCKDFGGGECGMFQGAILEFSWTEEKQGKAVRIASNETKTGIRYLHNTNLECYHYTTMIGDY